MGLEDLKILSKIEDLDVYSHVALMQFPKYEKFLLCSEIRQAITVVMKHVVRAAKRYHKKTTLQDLDIEIEFLRSLIRKSHKLKYISTRKYGIWIGHVNEIGKMAGGWLNSNRS